jgi:hypothetical protein
MCCDRQLSDAGKSHRAKSHHTENDSKAARHEMETARDQFAPDPGRKDLDRFAAV